jgi:guanylate kinase
MLHDDHRVDLLEEQETAANVPEITLADLLLAAGVDAGAAGLGLDAGALELKVSEWFRTVPLEHPAHEAVLEAVHRRYVSTTDRPRGHGEIPGITFHFVSADTFVEEVHNRKFIEHGQGDDGYSYGTPRPLIGAPSFAAADPKRTVVLGDLIAAGVLDPAVFPTGAPARLVELPLRSFAATVRQNPARYPGLADEYEATDVAVRAAVLAVTVPLTTRDRRLHEVPGSDYHFVSKAHMDHLRRTGQLFDAAQNNGHEYGTVWPDKSAFATTADGRLAPRAMLAREAAAAKGGTEPTFRVVAEAVGLAVAELPDGVGELPMTMGFAALCKHDDAAVDPAQLEAVRELVHNSNVPVTTRGKFKWEEDGREYTFVLPAAFVAMVERGEFFEYCQNAAGHFYGTLKLAADWSPKALSTGRKGLVERAISPANEATVRDLVGDGHPICSLEVAELGLSAFMAEYPPVVSSVQLDTAGLHSSLATQLFFAAVEAVGVLTTADEALAEQLCGTNSPWFPAGATDTVDPQRWEDLLKQNRMMTFSGLNRIEPDIYFECAVLKLWKTDAAKLAVAKAAFAASVVSSEQVNAIVVEARSLQSSVNQVRRCLAERGPAMDEKGMAGLLDRLAAAVSFDGSAPSGALDNGQAAAVVEEEDDDALPPPPPPPPAGGGGGAAAAAVAASSPNPELEGKLEAMAKAQEEQGSMLKRILDNFDKLAAAPPPPTPDRSRISPVKQRMESRRSMTAQPASPAGAGAGEAGSGAALTPLKKKLAERRARKEKQKNGGL